MKKGFLSGFFGLMAMMSFAQDTTWVQTYTFDTISTRRAEFQFPASLDSKRFEKVLMYYKLKCSPLTTWDNYNCGEWDYLAYTRIFDHTGIMDSVQKNGNKYLVNTSSPSTYPYSTVYYDQKWMPVQKRTPLLTTIHPISGTGTAPTTFVSANGNGKTLQWIIPAGELATSGVLAGDIQGMNLTMLNAFASLQGVQIRMKSTNATVLTALETSGFTTVFNNSLTGITNGSNTVNFSTPFTYDGSSSLIIELKFTDARQGLSQLDLEMNAVAGGNTLSFDNSNGVFTSNGTNYAEINLNNVNLGGDLTIAFWAKGNGNSGASTSIIEAADSMNNRILNIHLPWSNDNIYWDAGQGSGYDRIQKTATAASDVDDAWHHWAFVKNTSAGQMFIYKDGVQWHTGSGLTTPVATISKFILGAGKDLNNNWKGSIDEFSIWSAALDVATITSWKDKKIGNTHPNYSDLEVYYDFDGQLALIDRSAHNRLGMCSDLNMVQNNQAIVAGVEALASSPKIELIQGTMNAATADSVLVTQFPKPSVVFEYQPGPNSFHIVSNMLAYDQGTIDTFAVNGSVLQSAPSAVTATLTNQTITYYEVPFEEINDIEIGRYITPYGIGFDLGPQGFTWIYDVTDYQKYLHGMVDLAAHNTQELIDLKFAFIEGIPARDVHDIQPIWQNWTSYNYADMANDVVLQAKQVALSDTSANFKIRTRLTGHGQVGAGACCEWQDKQHKIIIDGVERFSWSIWRTDGCGENPNIGQGGTWPYAREGWCPGDMVADFDHELTSYVTPGDTVTIDYDISDVPVSDPGQAGGNFVTAIDLVSYSAPNFQHDAAILDVLNPNSYEYYSKWNPTCSNPRVILQNNGALPLTSCKIRVWVSYGNFIDYTWTGNLGFLQKEIVEIPITNQNFWFGANPASGFYARVIEISGSGSLDEYPNNDEFKTKYTAPEVINGSFFIWMTTNNKAAENKWRLVDQNGNIIFQRTTLTNNTDYKDTFNLSPGCYSVILEDSDDDGIGFWYSAQTEGETTGGFRVRKVGGAMMEIFPADFGSYHRYDFSVGFALGLDEEVLENELMIFPNPATDKIRVELVGNVGNNAKVEVIDMNGRVVKQQAVSNNNQTYAADLQVNELQNGYYLVRISGDNGSETTPFIKQ